MIDSSKSLLNEEKSVKAKKSYVYTGVKERLSMSAKIHSFCVFSFQKILFWG